MIRILRKKKLLLNQIVRFNSNKKKNEYLCIDPWSTPGRNLERKEKKILIIKEEKYFLIKIKKFP